MNRHDLRSSIRRVAFAVEELSGDPAVGERLVPAVHGADLVPRRPFEEHRAERDGDELIGREPDLDAIHVGEGFADEQWRVGAGQRVDLDVISGRAPDHRQLELDDLDGVG